MSDPVGLPMPTVRPLEGRVGVLGEHAPKPIKVVLTWTDAPAAGLGGSTPAWVNDLDLVVITGTGTFRGNVFDANGMSATGGTADAKNNIEAAFLLPADAAGGVEIRVVAATIAGNALPNGGDATDQDFATEWLDAVLSVKVVDGVRDALAHIRRYGSEHTEAIVTQDEAAAREFLGGLDSAVGMWNASTQFCDGGEFGFGAEIGIATGRLHARGPVGLEQLCTWRYHVIGTGQTRP